MRMQLQEAISIMRKKHTETREIIRKSTYTKETIHFSQQVGRGIYLYETIIITNTGKVGYYANFRTTVTHGIIPLIKIK